MSRRGFACIALDHPKAPQNIGGVMRIAGNFEADLIVLGNPRCPVRHAADPQKNYRHIPVLRVDDVFDALPFDCVPVAIDLLPNARPLRTYTHPERAFYIFGAEDATLGERITHRCRDVVFVETARCMNLAVTAAVVLYDRAVKMWRTA